MTRSSSDLPEYTRGNRIEPGSPVQGFERAIGNLGAATREIGEFGAQVAKNAAIEQATIEGVKAGKNPGRKLIPAFTESDKAFTQAYKKEEYNTVARSAEQYLNKTYFEVAKNPTSEGLSTYQRNASEQIQKLTDMVSEENRPALKRDLDSAFESKFYQLAGALQDKVKREAREAFKSTINDSVETIKELEATDQPQQSDEKAEGTRRYILSEQEAGNITETEAKEQLKALGLEVSTAKAQGEMQRKIKEDKGAEYLAEWADKPATPENVAVQEALLKQYQFHNSLIATQSHLYKNQAIEQAAAGTLTSADLIDFKSYMTERDASDVDSQISRINLKGIEQAQTIKYVKDNASNGVALSTVSNEAMDATFADDVSNFSKLKGQAPSMEQMASMAADYSRPIPSFNKQLSAAINSNNPAMAIKGAQVYSVLSRVNPRSVDGISKEDESRASMLATAIGAGEDPIEAVNVLNKKIDGLRKVGLEERSKRFDEKIQVSELKAPSKQESFVADQMGYKRDIIPSGLYSDYMKNLKNAFIVNDDWELSKEIAKKNIDRVYQRTNINGEEQIMWLSPTGNLPKGNNDIFLQNLVVNKCEKIFEAQKRVFEENSSGAGYYYKFANEVSPETNPIKYRRLHGSVESANTSANRSIPIIRVGSDGKEQRGSIYISSDDVTEFPPEGESPSYGMFFLPEGKKVPIPIYSPDNIGNMERFTVTERDVRLANSIRGIQEEALYAESLRMDAVRDAGTHADIANMGVSEEMMR